MEKYYMEFENNEENKLIYTDIFNEYVSTVHHTVALRGNAIVI